MSYPYDVIIIGAGEAGRSLAMEFETSAYVKSRVVCVIDDNEAKHGKRLCGVPRCQSGGRGIRTATPHPNDSRAE